ncbi:MAG TPA: hypothetical protein VKP61_08780 [Candidatus Acidoferrum sp.]|nr:hypothetical protein [Candidatus Acidoferrum sp.]
MPRKYVKKTGAQTAPLPASIQCPACQSRISSDGSTLYEKSKVLGNLQQTADSIGEVEKAADLLEAKYEEAKKRIVELEAELKNEREKKVNVEPKQKSGSEKPGSSWW